MMVVLYLAWLVLIYAVGSFAFIFGVNAMTGKIPEPAADLDFSFFNILAAFNSFWVLVGIVILAIALTDNLISLFLTGKHRVIRDVTDSQAE